MLPPVELLGIPLESALDYRDRVKLSNLAQKDSLLTTTFFPSNSFFDQVKFPDFETPHAANFAQSEENEKRDSYFNDGDDVQIQEPPFWAPIKSYHGNFMPKSVSFFTDLQMVTQDSSHKVPLVDKTAPNTPSGNEFSFMSPMLTPKK